MSSGCENCYVFLYNKNPEAFIINENFDYPIRKNKNGNYYLRSGEVVVVCSKSDFFLEEADDIRPQVWKMIKERKDIHFELQTRRSHRIKECLPPDYLEYKNVTIVIGIEDQKSFITRVSPILDLPFRIELMICPLLGRINLKTLITDNSIIKEIRCSGEGYAKARALYYDDVLYLSEVTKELGIPFYFIDTGAYILYKGRKIFIPIEERFARARKSNLSHN